MRRGVSWCLSALVGAAALTLAGCSAQDAVVTVRVGSGVPAPVRVAVVDARGRTVLSETLGPGESDRVAHVGFGRVSVRFGQICRLETTASEADRQIQATLDRPDRCSL